MKKERALKNQKLLSNVRERLIPVLSQNSPLKRKRALFWAFSALKQASELSKDAMFFYESGRFGSSLNLAILGIEEFAKALVLVSYVSGKMGQIEWEQTRENLKSHEFKVNVFIEHIRQQSERSFGESGAKFLEAYKRLLDRGIDFAVEIKSMREASVYTSANNDVIQIPRYLISYAQAIVPSLGQLAGVLADSYLELLAAKMPGITSAMQDMLGSNTDEEFLNAQPRFEAEAKRLGYFLSFIKTFFSDWQKAMIRIANEDKFETLMNIVCAPKNKRKIKISFEALSHAKLTDEQKWQILFDPKLNEKANEVFGIVKSFGLLIRN